MEMAQLRNARHGILLYIMSAVSGGVGRVGEVNDSNRWLALGFGCQVILRIAGGEIASLRIIPH
jgi:hypothetical protein